MDIITRDQAIQLGLKRYFTGKPCRNNHITQRRISKIGGECIECSRNRGNKPGRKLAHSVTSKVYWRTVDRAHRMILKQKHRAKVRNIEFAITEQDISPLPTHCPILDIELDYYSSKNGAHNIATIDRIDNSKGYIPGNVHIISLLANRVKGDINIEQLEKLLTYMKGK